jgi:AcrR family transcriptional regulator
MKMAAKRKQKRERGQSLNEADIIAAALGLIRVNGADALGMRGLAQALGVSPMAIYYHVPNKDQLLSRVAQTLLERLPPPLPSESAWREELHAYALAIWEMFSEYPGLSKSVMERPPMEATRRHTAHVLALFRAAGFDEHKAISCLLTFQTYLAGALAVQARVQAHRAPGAQEESRAKKIDRDMALYGELLSSRDSMSIGIATLVAGFDAHRPARAQQTPRAGRTRSA